MEEKKFELEESISNSEEMITDTHANKEAVMDDLEKDLEAYYDEQDKIRQNNLEEFYQSSYYQSVQRKKSNIKRVISGIIIAIAIYLGLVFWGGILLADKDEKAKTDVGKLEINLEQKYDIEIYTGDDIDNSQNGYTINLLYDSLQIREALKAIDTILDRLPEDFIAEIVGEKDGKHLEIHITGTMLIGYDDTRQAIGLASFHTDKNMIRIDATSGMHVDLQETFAHEIFHLIDYYIKGFEEYGGYLEEWKAYNPPTFEYSLYEGRNDTYLIEESDASNTYFVSRYAKEEIFEDRAETFAYLLATDEDEKLPKSYSGKYVKAKAKTLVNQIKTHFDSVYDDDKLYIERWFD